MFSKRSDLAGSCSLISYSKKFLPKVVDFSVKLLNSCLHYQDVRTFESCLSLSIQFKSNRISRRGIERYRSTYDQVIERIALMLNRRKGQMLTFWYPLFEIIWLLCKVLPWLLKHPITCLLHQFQSHLTRLCFANFVARGLGCRLRYIPACAAHNVVLVTAIR